jgi:hypothetical protein
VPPAAPACLDGAGAAFHSVPGAPCGRVSVSCGDQIHTIGETSCRSASTLAGALVSARAIVSRPGTALTTPVRPPRCGGPAQSGRHGGGPLSRRTRVTVSGDVRGVVLPAVGPPGRQRDVSVARSGASRQPSQRSLSQVGPGDPSQHRQDRQAAGPHHRPLTQRPATVRAALRPSTGPRLTGYAPGRARERCGSRALRRVTWTVPAVHAGRWVSACRPG